MTEPIDSDSPRKLLKEIDAANYLNIKVGTLRRWRWAGTGPRFIKVGAAVRYHPKDISEFVERNRCSATTRIQKTTECV